MPLFSMSDRTLHFSIKLQICIRIPLIVISLWIIYLGGRNLSDHLAPAQCDFSLLAGSYQKSFLSRL